LGGANYFRAEFHDFSYGVIFGTLCGTGGSYSGIGVPSSDASYIPLNTWT